MTPPPLQLSTKSCLISYAFSIDMFRCIFDLMLNNNKFSWLPLIDTKWCAGYHPLFSSCWLEGFSFWNQNVSGSYGLKLYFVFIAFYSISKLPVCLFKYFEILCLCNWYSVLFCLCFVFFLCIFIFFHLFYLRTFDFQ